MFLFSCSCIQSKYSYQIRENFQTIHNSNNLKQQLQRVNPLKHYLIKVKKAQLKQIVEKKWNQKSTDKEFRPSKQSLGQNLDPNTNWKRLSQLVLHPTLFTTTKSKIKKKLKQSLTRDYLLSALSAIAEEPNKLKDIFVTQSISNDGIYVLKMRVDGEIQQVVIDDYVPVNQLGNPLFLAPNQSEIWLCLAQKAWAKINGSYQNTLIGNTAEVFKTFNFAPSEIFHIEDKLDKIQKLWKLLTEAVQRKSPVSCLTSHNKDIDWIHLNLIPHCSYTLIYATDVYQKNQEFFRMVRLKNINSDAKWEREGSIHDKKFWESKVENQQKIKLLASFDQDSGQILMRYADFVKYFSEVQISYQLQQGNFIWEDVKFNSKNGLLFQIDIIHDGEYSFELHRQSIRNESEKVRNQSFSRSTLILAKINGQNNYEFILGSMKFDQQDTLLHSFLKQSKYIIYAKIQLQNKDLNSSLSCYSNKVCILKLTQKKKYQNFLQNMFLSHSKLNKRQQYNYGKMWVAWKLLFKDGGFAYIAFGNAANSEKKFNIKFQSKNFKQSHFKLKSPYRVKQEQQEKNFLISVLPARVCNDRAPYLKFPPPIQINVQDILK